MQLIEILLFQIKNSQVREMRCKEREREGGRNNVIKRNKNKTTRGKEKKGVYSIIKKYIFNKIFCF